MANQELTDLLQRTAMFRDFTPEDNRMLARYLMSWNARQDDIVFREGERSGHMCLLVSGRLEVRKAGARAEMKLTEITPGRVIGEMSMIDGQPYSATVVASEPSRLVLLPRDNFLRIAAEHPRLAVKLLMKVTELLSLRLRQTTGKLLDHL